MRFVVYLAWRREGIFLDLKITEYVDRQRLGLFKGKVFSS